METKMDHSLDIFATLMKQRGAFYSQNQVDFGCLIRFLKIDILLLSISEIPNFLVEKQFSEKSELMSQIHVVF